MNEIEIKENVIHALKLVTGKKDINIKDETLLFEELGLESIDFVDLIFETEKRLKCEIDLNQLVVSAQSTTTGGRYTYMTFKAFTDFVKKQIEQNL